MRRWFNGRERVLVGLFTLQLAAATVLGLLFINSLNNRSGGVQVASEDGANPAGGSGATEQPAGATTGGGSAQQPGEAGGTTDAAGGGAATTSGTSNSKDAGDGSGGGQAQQTGSTGSSGSAGSPAVKSGEPITIGTLVTQTGAINFKGAAQATAAYIDQVNADGGVNGHKLQLIIRDDSLDASKGRRAVEEMINQGAFAFVSFAAPLTEQSILPTLENNEIPLVGSFGAAPSEWAFEFNGDFESYGWVTPRFLVEQGVKNPGLVFISQRNDEIDQRLIKSFQRGFESKGVQLSNENIYSVDATKSSYDDVVTELRVNQVDGVISLLDTTAVVRFQQSLNRANYHPTHAAGPTTDSPAVLEDPDVGESLNGTFVFSDTYFLGSGTGAVPEYEQAVRERFGQDAQLSWTGKFTWVSTKMFVDAMRAAGESPSRADLMQALRSMKDHETGMSPPLTVGSDPYYQKHINTCTTIGKIVSAKIEQVQDFTCFDPKKQ